MHESNGRRFRFLLSLLLALLAIPSAFAEVPVSDPVIAHGVGSQSSPAAASDGRDFLFAWVDGRSGQDTIYAMRVAADGGVLDAEGIEVSRRGQGAGRPSVAWIGNSYLAVWTEQSGCAFRRIHADGRLGETGRVFDGTCSSTHVAGYGGRAIVSSAKGFGRFELAVIDETDHARTFAELNGSGSHGLACTSSECLMAWDSHGTLRGRRISRDGELIDTTDRVFASGVMDVSVAATEERFLLVWRDRTEYGTPSAQLWGRELDSQQPFVITATEKAVIGNARVTASGRGFFVAWNQGVTKTRVRAESVLPPHTGPMPPPIRLFELRAKRVGDSDEEITFVSPVGNYEPAIASNGVSHLGAWTKHPWGKVEASVARGGTTRSVAPARSASLQMNPQIVRCGDHLLVVWSEEVRGDGVASVMARRFAFSGEPLDATPIVIAQSPYSQTAPVAAFDGHSYLIAWSENRSGRARGMNLDGTLALDVQSFSAPGAIAALERGFAVLHGNVLTQFPAGAPVVSTRLSGLRGRCVIGWNGSELVTVCSGATGLRATRVTRDGVLLDPEPIVFGRGVHGAEAVSMSCEASQCIVAWYEFLAGVKTAVIVGDAAYSIVEPIRDPSDYRPTPPDRYQPSVIRVDAGFDVLSYGPGGLYRQALREGVAFPETFVRETHFGPIAATPEGFFMVYARPVYEPPHGGVQRLFLRRVAE